MASALTRGISNYLKNKNLKQSGENEPLKSNASTSSSAQRPTTTANADSGGYSRSAIARVLNGQKSQTKVTTTGTAMTKMPSKQEYIYGSTDVSGLTYQTVGEYDAKIGDLIKQVRTVPTTEDGKYDAKEALSKKRKDFEKETNQEIQRLKAERTLLERATYIDKTYGGLKNNPDYAKKSVAILNGDLFDSSHVGVNQAAYQNQSGTKDHYGWVDGGWVTDERAGELAQKYDWDAIETSNRIAAAVSGQQEESRGIGEVANKKVSSSLEWLNDEERGVYNYLYNTAGADAADKYLEDMKIILQKRQTAADEWGTATAYNNADAVGKYAMNVGTLITSQIGNVVAGVNDLTEAVTGQYSPYGSAHSLQNWTDTVRGETAQDIYTGVVDAGGSDGAAQLASTVYQGVMSGADSVVGGLTLGSGYLAVASSGAATRKARELYENGASGWQIAAGSAASGLIEWGMEKIPLEELLNYAGGTKGVKSLFYNILKQGGMEGPEEGLTEIANLAVDSLIQGGNSDLSRGIATYEKQDYTSAQARQMAARDKAMDVLWATVGGMAGGAGSATVMSTVGLARDYQQANQIGQAVLQQEGGLEQAVAAGLSNVPYSEAYKTAQKMQASIQDGTGDKVSAYEVGKMLLESQSEEAVAARTRYRATMDSARAQGITDERATTAATVAARTGRTIEFVSPDQLQVDGTDGQFAIKKSADNEWFVDVQEDILTGVAEQDVPRALADIVQNKFHNYLQANGQTVGISSRTNSEWRKSRNAQQLLRENPTAYWDKIQAFNNADELLQASRSWIGEATKHDRKDNITEFARGVVLFRVGQNGYAADVIVGTRNDGSALLYDLVGIKEKAIADSTNNGFYTEGDGASPIANTTLSQNSFGVNTHSMQEGGKYTPSEAALGKYTADGRILLSTDISDEATLHFILKHELAHSIEGTATWDAILQVVKRQMGREAWDKKVAATAKLRQEKGDTVGAANPEREAVADWIGENLYKENFAQALARNDRQAANLFVRVMDKLRLAFAGTGDKGNAARIAALERMYLRALESEQTDGQDQYAVNYKKNTLVKKKRSVYNQFREVAMQWAHSYTTKPGDLHIFSLDNKTSVLIEATESGYVELMSGRHSEVRRFYEQAYGRATDEIYGNTKSIKGSQGSDIWDMRLPQDGGYDVGDGESFGGQGFQGVTAGDNQHLRAGNQGEFVISPQSNTEATESSSTVSETTGTEAGFAIPQKGSYSFLPPDLAAANEQARQAENARQEQAAADADAIHRQAVERAAGGQASTAPSQAQTLEELEQELGEEELHRRMYMAEQMERPSATIEVDGQEVDTAAYMRAVEELLPEDTAALEQFIRDADRRAVEDVRRAYEDGTLEQVGSLPINLQLFAARCKLEWAQITQNEGGKEIRQYYAKRAAGMDENHHQEFVDMLAGRGETYNPIANQKTLDRAKDKLRNSEWKDDLEKRLFNYREGSPMFSAVEGAAIQVMINDALNDGNYEQAMGMVTQYARCGTDMGRAVQIMSLMRRLTPEGTIKAAIREYRKAEDKVMGKHTSESLDILADTVTDAITRLKGSRVMGSQADTAASADGTTPAPQGGEGTANPLTNEELADALVANIRQNNDPYITEKEVRGILHRAIENAADMPAHLKKMLLKDETMADLAERIAKVVENGHLNDATTRQAFVEALGLPSLSGEDVGQLTELVNRMNSLETGTLEHQEAMEDIYRFIGERLPVSGWEMWQAWRKLAMLSNPKTHIRNFVSNVVMYGTVHQADTVVAAALEKLLIKDPAKRTTLLGWSRTEHGRQITDTVDKATERALVQMRRGGGKYDIAGSKLAGFKKYFGTSKVGEALNKASDFNSAWLEKGDAKTFRWAFRDALGQIMTVRGMTEVTEEVFQQAYDQAAEVTFRAENGLAAALNAAKRKGGVLGTAADIAIPFTKTPANIAVQMLQHSPVGLAKGAYDLVQSMRGAKDAKTAADAINELAKGITGSALLAIGLLLGSMGLFNTKYGKTEKERAADELAGVQENALLLPGGWSITLDWLQPAAAPLVIGASIAQRLQEDGIGLGTVFGAVMDGTDSLFELTMLQSLYDILGGYDAGVSSSMASVLENAVSQSVPTLLGQAARSIDPVQRRPSGEGPIGGEFGKYLNQVLAKVPVLTYLLEPELDVWGDEVYRTGKADTTGGWLNFFQQTLSPANVKRATAEDDITLMLLDMYENAEEKGSYAIPSAPSRDDASDMDMLYADMARNIGRAQRQAVEDLVADNKRYTVQETTASGRTKNVSKTWSQMNESERLRVLNRIYGAVKENQKNPDDDYYMQLLKGVQ